MTERRTHLEGMLEEYVQLIEEGQEHEDVIAKLSQENSDRERRIQREASVKRLSLVSTSEPFIDDFRKNLKKFEKIETVHFAKKENIDPQKKDDFSEKIPKEAIEKIRNYLDKSPTAFDLALKEENSYLLKLAKKVQNNFLFHSLLLHFSSDIKNREEAKTKFVLDITKDSIVNLALDSKLRSSYYDASNDIRKVVDIFKDLSDSHILPQHIVKTLGTYDEKLGTQVFSSNVEDHNSYTVTKAYDELVEYYNNSYGITLKQTDELINDRIDDIGQYYRTANVLESGKKEKMLDVYTRSLVKSSAILSELSDTLNLYDVKISKYAIDDNFVELNESLSDVRNEIATKSALLANDISSLSDNIELPLILKDIVELKESNLDFITEKIMQGKLPQTKKDIFVNIQTITAIDELKDRYTTIVDQLDKNILTLQNNSIGEEEKEKILISFPAQVYNLEKIESGINEEISNVVYANNIVEEDIKEDVYVHHQMKL